MERNERKIEKPKAVIRKKCSRTHSSYKHDAMVIYGNVIIGNNSGNCGNSDSVFGGSPCSQTALEIDEILKSLTFSQRAKVMKAFIDIVEKLQNE